MSKKNAFISVLSLLIIGIFLVHHKLIYEFLCQDFRTYLFVIDLVYKKTLYATHTFPLWQNYLMCGISYIVNLPFLFSVSRALAIIGFPPVFAWAISEYAFMIAGTLSFFFLMRLYRCADYVSWFGALMFQFFVYRLGSSESYPMSLAAVIFLICEKYDKRQNFIYIALGAISVGITCSSGIIHGVLLILLFQFLLIAYYAFKKIGKEYRIACASSWGLGIILALPTLLPQIRDVAVSQRLFYERYQMGLSVFNLKEFACKLNEIMYLRLFFPISVICCILAVISIFYIREKKILGFYLAALFSVFMYIFLSFTQGLWKDLPFIGKYIFAIDVKRAICLIGFFTIFLSTYTINSLVNKLSCNYGKKSIAAVTLLMALGCGFICLPYLSKGSLLVRAGVFLFVISNLYLREKAVKKVNYLFGILLLCYLSMTFLNLYSRTFSLMKQNNLPLIKTVLSEKPLVDSMDLFPGETSAKKEAMVNTLKHATSPQHFRSIELGSDKMFYEVKFLANQIECLVGTANVYPARYYEFFKWLIDDLRTKAPEKYKFFTDQTTYVYGLGSNYNENLLSLAGVKWIIVPNNVKESRFIRALSGNTYSLYRNDKAFSRVFPVFEVNILETKKDMAEFMMKTNAEDFSESVPMLKADAAGLFVNLINKYGRGKASIIKYNPNEVIIKTDFTENGLLVLTDNFHKSWKAAVDGSPAKIYPAYYTFRAIQVPKGAHTIRFYLVDKIFFYSTILSLVTLFGMIPIAIILK